MLAFGPLSFAAPWALAGLAALPAIWFLLRATPPAPKRAVFPPLRLLLGAPDDLETPQHAPWWLILFRLLMAALLIVALARPVWTPPSSEIDTAPALIIVDNGWAAAPAWPQTVRTAEVLINEARQTGRSVALVLTAPDGLTENEIRLGPAGDALRQLESARLMPWPANRMATTERIDTARTNGALADNLAIDWLSDGLDTSGRTELLDSLRGLGPVRLHEPDSGRAALALGPPEITLDGLTIEVQRSISDLPRTSALVAVGADGRAIARSDVSFDAGEASTTAAINLPLDLRNRIASLRLEGQQSAASVRLLADRWRRPRVGLLSAEVDEGQPLLSDLHYVENAIAPYGITTRGTLDGLMEQTPAVLIMTDDARTEDSRLDSFLAEGGVLLRFAGPRLAARGDAYLPVDLREGGRLFGGALNWEEPQNLAEFTANSPFAGLPVDETATVDRQVLAQPGSATPERVWARLSDGTPLVTAERRGRGWIVLFHVTAGPTWSDLPLSGLFPRMLERVLGLAQGGPVENTADGAWVLDRALDAGGQLTAAPASARPVAATSFDTTPPAPTAPPGLYRLGSATNALNIIGPETRLEPLPRGLSNVVYQGSDGPRPVRFQAGLLVALLVMMMLDVLIALALAGRLRLPGARSAMTASAVLLAGLALPLAPADAQTGQPISENAMSAALSLRFGYVQTGDAALDERSRQGLTGLSRELARRSAIEPEGPLAINVETDELIFFPAIYWPITRDAQPLAPEAATRVSTYLQSGGLIVFDTQDADTAMLRAGAPHPGLVAVLESLDIPPLAQIPGDHVLTRAFYLLQDFPGRYSGSPVWVEANPDGASRDGTSGVIIGSNDWASAWAVDANGRPVAQVDGGDRQRELAVRFGVNIAMYALTGNYKADQVHVPDILERLGQ